MKKIVIEWVYITEHAHIDIFKRSKGHIEYIK